MYGGFIVQMLGIKCKLGNESYVLWGKDKGKGQPTTGHEGPKGE